jgi:hypothetical protein
LKVTLLAGARLRVGNLNPRVCRPEHEAGDDGQSEGGSKKERRGGASLLASWSSHMRYRLPPRAFDGQDSFIIQTSKEDSARKPDSVICQDVVMLQLAAAAKRPY